MKSPWQAVAFAATAVAQSAIGGSLDALDVEELVTQATAAIDDADDPLRRAVLSFATQYQVVRHSPDDLTWQGRILRDAVLAARPKYDWQERADVR